MLIELIQDVRTITGDWLTFARTIELDDNDLRRGQAISGCLGIEDDVDDETDEAEQLSWISVESVERDADGNTIKIIAQETEWMGFDLEGYDRPDDDEMGMPGWLVATVYRDWTLRGTNEQEQEAGRRHPVTC